MNGMISMFDITSASTRTNARAWLGLTISRNKLGITLANGGADFAKCEVSEGTMRNAPIQITAQNTTSNSNADCQPKRAPSATPAGTPTIDASENDVITSPI